MCVPSLPRPQTSSGTYIASSISMRDILKAIRAGIGFGSGTETSVYHTEGLGMRLELSRM